MDSQTPDTGDLSRSLGIAGAILTILVAVFTLTGFNPLAAITGTDKPGGSEPSTTPAAPIDPQPVEDPTTENPNDDAPDFTVESTDWNGPCSNGCSMTAIFHNWGGMAGSATATFYVIRPSTGNYLARCSVVIPNTAHNDKTSAGCTASSANLQQYFQSYDRVQLDVIVDNPG